MDIFDRGDFQAKSRRSTLLPPGCLQYNAKRQRGLEGELLGKTEPELKH